MYNILCDKSATEEDEDMAASAVVASHPMVDDKSNIKCVQQPTERAQVNQVTSAQPLSAKLITIQGTINGHKAIVLVDCGASGNFVSEQFVQQYKLSLTNRGRDKQSVTLADGTVKTLAGVLS